MTLPAFYEPDRVGTLYRPRVERAQQEGRALDLPPSGEDESSRILLLLIDAQVDFIHEDGSLRVPGAVADTRRTIEWLFAHTAEVTAVAASLDTHIPLQIFYSTWWANADGEHPEPFTPITAEEVDSGLWQPLYQPEWSVSYVHQLQERAKKDLMIWPFHTMLGTPGHAMTPALYEAVIYHAAARQSQPRFVTKGAIANTEYYSLLEPEVKVPEDPRGSLNRDFLDEILAYDRVYVAGQAKSHCVLETMSSIMRYHGDDPETTSKFHLLADCTSPVQHPEIDFEAMANETYQRFEQRGLQLVRSTDPL